MSEPRRSAWREALDSLLLVLEIAAMGAIVMLFSVVVFHLLIFAVSEVRGLW